MQELAPVQERVWEKKVQPISQGGYGYEQNRLAEQELLPFAGVPLARARRVWL